MKFLAQCIRIFHCIFAIFISIPLPSIIQHICIWITIITQLYFKKCILSDLENRLNNEKIPFVYEWTYPYHHLSVFQFLKLARFYLLGVFIIGFLLRYFLYRRKK